MRSEAMPIANENEPQGGMHRSEVEANEHVTERMSQLINSVPEAVRELPVVYLRGREFPIETSYDQMAAEQQRLLEGAQQLFEDAKQQLADAEKTNDNEAIKSAASRARLCAQFVQAVQASTDMAGVYLDARNEHPEFAKLLEDLFPHLPEQLKAANDRFSERVSPDS